MQCVSKGQRDVTLTETLPVLHGPRRKDKECLEYRDSWWEVSPLSSLLP